MTIKSDKQIFIGEERVTHETMANVLDTMTQANKETTIFFQADKTVDYETLMGAMDSLRKAGYLKVGLVGMETVSTGN